MVKKKRVQITAVEGSIEPEGIDLRFEILNVLVYEHIDTEDKEGFTKDLKRIRKKYSDLFDTNRISIQVL